MSITSDVFRRAAGLVESWRRPLLLTHARPDGDAVGCLVAMQAMLRARGADPHALLFGPVSDRCSFLWKDDPLTMTVDAAGAAARADEFAPDGVVILDTCSRVQLEPIAEWLGRSSLPKIAVDHHVTRDLPADEYLIDESAAAAALVVLEWATAARWPVDRRVAEALFVGLATDTGWFRYSNTDPRALQAAAHLATCGASASALHEAIYNRESPARVRLEAAALGTLELHADGRLAVMTLEPRHFAQSGATPADTEDIVNGPMRIEGVWASALLVAHEPGLVRVSLRSRPPSDSVPDINVATVASTLGGGGHARAAGARVQGSLDSVKQQVIDRLRQA